MKASEFYQKYWRIKTNDGHVLPLKLTEEEAVYLDQCVESGKNGLTAYLFSPRRRPKQINIDCLKKEIEKYLDQNTEDASFKIIEPKQLP